jgi:hypothetical protein
MYDIVLSSRLSHPPQNPLHECGRDHGKHIEHQSKGLSTEYVVRQRRVYKLKVAVGSSSAIVFTVHDSLRRFWDSQSSSCVVLLCISEHLYVRLEVATRFDYVMCYD